ncbi:hypothetical protein MYX64_09780 [Nitrospinae bacterium AH_259_B05_G02_I21]|nr:hypothetical protein [Nitrospinae bacterium AH_259_B05_G02_I21]MDA2931998.1 hypothetical protein [Nitrospinae bacterium AH-259-F20]
MVGVEYVGDAPVVVSLKEKGALGSRGDIVIRAEKSGYTPSTRILSNEALPNRLFFTLEKAPSPSATSGLGQQQEQQQQMQGPTIVITPGKAEVGGQNTQ